MKYLKANKGFTLVEMIGVMAVIAILAAIAAPRVFDAIQDAKVTSLVQQINSFQTAATQIYKDTGRFPRYLSTNTNAFYNTFMNKNSLNTANADMPGWNGPYLDNMPAHPITPGARQEIVNTNNNAYICDADGDGTNEGPWLTYRVDGLDRKVMEKVSNIIDGDGGTTNWATTGKVKEYNGNNARIMVVCLVRT
ncbi:prepilin-type N-terminal cleavage/methylation domain-containing protein [Glaciecola petra]|uniref:Prepilin-type N-terminal cleavage/methylation domain-containing protein n=1 Tax=Glaciecola petra TaxID=3075602 RepID=A0ABU2ZS83_9ALTE|nr:prepilin-type N-terminal cleavage/methylation domain-containing protein [Aestuariibacter sp. P117]MDT0595480.1 prepilin-type N-terminal cleavage/methylation domain-containing protein [Aestuariibacter sp. P117]